MVGDLATEERGFEILRDRTRDVVNKLRLVSVATVGDYISSGAGGSGLAELGRGAGETIGDAVMTVSRDLDDFFQSVNDLINAYNATENDTAVTFQQTTHGGPAMTMDDLRHGMEEQQ